MKKFRTLLMIVIVLVTAIGVPAQLPSARHCVNINTVNVQAKTLTNKAAGVQFTLPAGWVAEDFNENTLGVAPADKTIIFTIETVEADQIDKSIDASFARIDKMVQDQKVTNKGKEGEINGLKYWEAEGTGTYKGAEVSWDVHIVIAKKPLIFIGLYFPESLEKHGEELGAFINSINKAE